jgi:hypothetical protein
MPNLNDAQTFLLSTASQRPSGSVLPLPDGVTPGTRVTKALAALTASALIEELETTDSDSISRSDGDLRFGLFITAEGLQAIGVEPEHGATPAPQPDMPAATAPRSTKSAAVLALLGRDEGVTLAELIAATGWLPHTTRAALTGLRKKGHAITRAKRDDQTCYTVAAA